MVTDAAGTVVKKLDCDSFGQLVSDSAPAFYLPIGFAGGLADVDTGLVRFGFRDYDPATGRWTAKDPIFFKSGQANLYGYCGSDPVNFRDLSGLHYRDKTYGLSPDFWNWYHRQYKEEGQQNASQAEAMQAHDEWEEQGRPGPDNKGKCRPGRTKGGRLKILGIFGDVLILFDVYEAQQISNATGRNVWDVLTENMFGVTEKQEIY